MTGNLDAVRAFEGLGGALSPPLEALRIWYEVAALHWPEDFNTRRRFSLLEILDSEHITTLGHETSCLVIFNHFASLLASVQLTRLRAVATTISSFEEVLAAKHFGVSASPSSWWL